MVTAEATVLHKTDPPCLFLKFPRGLTAKLDLHYFNRVRAPIDLESLQSKRNISFADAPFPQLFLQAQRSVSTADTLAGITFCKACITLQILTGQPQELFVKHAFITETAFQFPAQFPNGVLTARQQIHRRKADIRWSVGGFRRFIIRHNKKRHRAREWGKRGPDACKKSANSSLHCSLSEISPPK
jgi:hypothetical protein